MIPLLTKLMADITHFETWELTQPMRTEPPIKLVYNIVPTLRIVETMRECLGFPMTFSSTYRDTEHNRDVGGSINSSHLEFNALDIYPVSGSKAQLELMQSWLLNADYEITHRDIKINKEQTGIGIYEDFVHFDTRGYLDRDAPVRW